MVRCSPIPAFALLAAGLVLGQGSSTLTVTGDVPTPLTLKAEDLASMPREKAAVPDPNGKAIEYEGVLLRDVLKRAGAPLEGQLRRKALASYVLTKAHDGYQVVFTLGEIDAQFGNEPILIADKRDGMPLPANQGPFRLVCPHDKEGARSVRMLETIEFVLLQK